MKTLLAIACGGAAGSVLRYLCNSLATRMGGSDFPWGTITINVLGSLAMGVAAGLFSHSWQPSQEIRAFLTTGLLGGFTTFSAFSLDSALLMERGNTGYAVLYITGSVGLSITALFFGLAITRIGTA